MSGSCQAHYWTFTSPACAKVGTPEKLGHSGGLAATGRQIEQRDYKLAGQMCPSFLSVAIPDLSMAFPGYLCLTLEVP